MHSHFLEVNIYVNKSTHVNDIHIPTVFLPSKSVVFQIIHLKLKTSNIYG